jgi:hypothetical protein
LVGFISFTIRIRVFFHLTQQVFLIIYYQVTGYIIADAYFFSAKKKWNFEKSHRYVVKQISVRVIQYNINARNVHPKQATKAQKGRRGSTLLFL